MNFNTILPNLGIPSNCKICNESYYGLDKCGGICPQCSTKQDSSQNSEQKEIDFKQKITAYLNNHQWRIKLEDGDAEQMVR